jgi:hypothetical protein
MINVYIGWDSREQVAYDVCVDSILEHSSIKGAIYPLKQQQLREFGFYTRNNDERTSTEFTYTRFLVPFLNAYKGWAIFCDCDFLWLTDIKQLFLDIEKENNHDLTKAVYVAQHDYIPNRTVKMDGIQQTTYPRKNWSSLIMWSCEHPSNRQLTPELISSVSGSFLHRFEWLNNNEIGKIPLAWNWLVDEYNEKEYGKAKALHYTNGGPWFSSCQNCAYADLWNSSKARYTPTKN